MNPRSAGPLPQPHPTPIQTEQEILPGAVILPFDGRAQTLAAGLAKYIPNPVSLALC